MTRDEIIDLQTKLHNRGYGPVEIDGIYGPQTAAAYAVMLKMNPVGGIDQPLPVPAPAKPWWASKAIIGSVVTVALSVLGAFVDWQVDAESLTDVIYQIVLAASGLLAFIGTVRRKAPIDPTLVLPGIRTGTQRVPADRDRDLKQVLPQSARDYADEIIKDPAKAQAFLQRAGIVDAGDRLSPHYSPDELRNQPVPTDRPDSDRSPFLDN